MGGDSWPIDFSQLDIPFCYISGVLAAGSPCVVVLIPLILYRFRGNTHFMQLLYFTSGFIVSYVGLGYAASQAMRSPFQNGFKLGLGAIFTLLGVLSSKGKVAPPEMNLLKGNEFILGAGFALLISVNPCTLPFLAIVISLHTTNALISLSFFGLGMLTPSLLFVLVGKASIKAFTKYGEILQVINKVMNLILCFSGGYLVISTLSLTIYDACLAAAMLSLATVCIFRIYQVKSLFMYAFSVGASVVFVLFFWMAEGHSEIAHDTSTVMPSTTGSEDLSAANLKCIDPSFMLCKLCQKFVYIFAFAIAMSVVFLLVGEDEVILPKILRPLERRFRNLLKKTKHELLPIASNSNNNHFQGNSKHSCESDKEENLYSRDSSIQMFTYQLDNIDLQTFDPIKQRVNMV